MYPLGCVIVRGSGYWPFSICSSGVTDSVGNVPLGLACCVTMKYYTKNIHVPIHQFNQVETPRRRQEELKNKRIFRELVFVIYSRWFSFVVILDYDSSYAISFYIFSIFLSEEKKSLVVKCFRRNDPKRQKLVLAGIS